MTVYPIQKTPMKLGATAWYTAKRGVTSSGGLVSRWDNQIKYSNPYTQGTSSNQPTITTLRDLPVLVFQGTPQKSIATTSSPTNSSRTFSCFTASMISANNLTSDIVIAQTSLFLHRYEYLAPGAITSFINVGGGYEPRLSYSEQSNSIPNIAVASYNDSGGSHSLNVNNGVATTNTRTPSGASLGAASISNPTTNSQSLYMHEQIWFDRVLTAAETLEVVRWLSNEWGIAIS